MIATCESRLRDLISKELEGRSQQVDEELPIQLYGCPQGYIISGGLSSPILLHLLMQEQHAEMVAAVLRLRLKPDGTALIALAIRDEVCPLSLQEMTAPS